MNSEYYDFSSRLISVYIVRWRLSVRFHATSTIYLTIKNTFTSFTYIVEFLAKNNGLYITDNSLITMSPWVDKRAIQ